MHLITKITNYADNKKYTSIRICFCQCQLELTVQLIRKSIAFSLAYFFALPSFIELWKCIVVTCYNTSYDHYRYNISKYSSFVAAHYSWGSHHRQLFFTPVETFLHWPYNYPMFTNITKVITTLLRYYDVGSRQQILPTRLTLSLFSLWLEIPKCGSGCGHDTTPTQSYVCV